MKIGILAAGLSKRMGNINKLLIDVGFKELVESLGLENGICITDNYFLEGIYNRPNSKWLEITIKKNFAASDSDKPTNADGYQFEFYYQSISLNTTKFTKDLCI